MAAIGRSGNDWVSQLRAISCWWRGGLASCLPEILRTGRRLVAEPEAGELVVHRETASGNQELGRYSIGADRVATPAGGKRARGRHDRVILRIPAGNALRREMELPLAVEAELDSMLRLGMDRYTPYTADQVYFDYRVMPADRESKRLRLQLVVVPRPLVDTWLAAMARHGLQPRAIDVAPDDAGFNLLPADLRPRRSRAAHSMNLVLALLVLALLVTVIAMPLWRQHVTNEDLARQVGAARREAEQVLVLRDELEQVVATSQFLVAKKHKARATIEVLNALTRLLPDGSWVRRLDIDVGKVQIRGESRKATALVGLLAASPLFSNPVFRSPVTQNPTTGRERFHLEIRIVGEVAE